MEFMPLLSRLDDITVLLGSYFPLDSYLQIHFIDKT